MLCDSREASLSDHNQASFPGPGPVKVFTGDPAVTPEAGFGHQLAGGVAPTQRILRIVDPATSAGEPGAEAQAVGGEGAGDPVPQFRDAVSRRGPVNRFEVLAEKDGRQSRPLPGGRGFGGRHAVAEIAVDIPLVLELAARE